MHLLPLRPSSKISKQKINKHLFIRARQASPLCLICGCGVEIVWVHLGLLSIPRSHFFPLPIKERSRELPGRTVGFLGVGDWRWE